jgi:hypothetical protein
LELNRGEEEYSQDRVQKQEEEEQTSYVGQLRDGANECVEEDSQTLVLLYDLEDPADSERSDDCGESSDVDTDGFGKEPEPSGNDNDQIEIVPATTEKGGAQPEQLHGCFDCVDKVEHQVHLGQCFLEALGLAIPCQCQTDSVENNAQEDESVEDGPNNDPVAGVSEPAARGLELDPRLLLVAEDQHFAPVRLRLRQQMVHLQGFLLHVEYVDDDTHEHIQNEQ